LNRTARYVLALSSGAVAMATACSRSTAPQSKPREAVEISGHGTLAIAPDSVFGKKLDVVTITSESIAIPLFTVTGSVVAQLRPGEGERDDRWQFGTAEAQGAWADWRRTRGEITFDERQLQASRDLAESRLRAQTAVVERLRKLVELGTDSQKDLAQEEANLAQARLEGQKDVFAAQSALVAATRTAAGLERQLLQAGVDPKLLGSLSDGAVIVAAEVPETRVGAARLNQACVAHFYSAPDVAFQGTVRSLGTAVSRDRRTLPVLFELHDAERRLRPGMFADIGLGAEERPALLVPADAVLHIDRADYVIVRDHGDTYHVTPLRIGETYDNRVQALDGVKAGDGVVGAGAILLKPYVAAALAAK
jgi:hypothetical protein